jgi:hypothetical protein
MARSSSSARSSTAPTFPTAPPEKTAGGARESRNAEENRGAAVERGLSKGSDLYVNPDWDLVDALRADKVRLEDLQEADLPEELRKLDLAAKKVYIEEKAKKREEIRGRLVALRETREATLGLARIGQATATAGKPTEGLIAGGRGAGAVDAAGGSKTAGDVQAGARPEAPASGATGAPATVAAPVRAPGRQTIDSAVIGALRKQAEAKGYSFGEKKIRCAMTKSKTGSLRPGGFCVSLRPQGIARTVNGVPKLDSMSSDIETLLRWGYVCPKGELPCS